MTYDPAELVAPRAQPNVNQASAGILAMFVRLAIQRMLDEKGVPEGSQAVLDQAELRRALKAVLDEHGVRIEFHSGPAPT